jgi:hypothetical protein
METKGYLELSELYSSIYNDVSESHYKVGDKVLSKSSGMKGEVVKVDSEESGDYYTVKHSDGKTAKYSPDELKKGNGGAPKEKEEKFHTKLDKLVHKTFGKSPEEQNEETDLFVDILEYLVAEGYADTNENALAIMENMSEDWRDSIVEEVLDEGYKEFPSDKVKKQSSKHMRNFLTRPNSHSGQTSKKRSTKMDAIRSTVEVGDDPRKTMHGQDLRKIR